MSFKGMCKFIILSKLCSLMESFFVAASCYNIVKVKWGKVTFNDVEVNTDEEPILFKAVLFDLTGVQPERQKVMIKGITLKDDEWGNFKLKDVSHISLDFILFVYSFYTLDRTLKQGAVVLLMGSKEEDVPNEPQQKQVFVEDMNDDELASAVSGVSSVSSVPVPHFSFSNFQ